MPTITSVDKTEETWEVPKEPRASLQKTKLDKTSAEVIKAALKKLKGPNIDDPESFTMASSDAAPEGTIVLHENFLNFSSMNPTGMPGIFRSPLEHKKLQYPQYKRSSYDLTIEDIPLSMYNIIRYILFPASDITVIPMKLGSVRGSGNVRKTEYYLQPIEGDACMTFGYRKNVELDLVFWNFERYTHGGGIYGGGARRFPIRSAILLDPDIPKRFRPSETPVCLLGMDFLTKYPYLMFIPKLDPLGEIDFTLAGDPLVYRPYSTFVEVSKTLVVNIAARHDTGTGRIGCGIFFKSGSILNIFSGVSEYDKDGKKHMENLWERGILMGVIKALHVITSFSAGDEFTDVVIRTGSPPINQLLAQIQNTKDELFKEMSNSSGTSLGSGFSSSLPHLDLVIYIRYQFLRGKSLIKIHFEGFSSNENYDAVEAAGILATGGVEMKEFCLKNPVKKYNQKDIKDQNITILEQNPDFKEEELYVSFGIDGNFYIPSKRALRVMEEADKKASLLLSKEDAINKLGYPAWEGEIAAKTDGLLEKGNYDLHEFSPASDFRTIVGILGEDAVKKLDHCLENSEWTPEDILEIIKSSTRKIKVHEYLGLQNKEYRDNYLKELERKGLEKGWHFCKDKSWNGYLRRNSKAYDRMRLPNPQGKKKTIEEDSDLSDSKKELDHRHEEKGEEKTPKIEENFQSTSNTEIGDATGGHTSNKALCQEDFDAHYSERSDDSDCTTEDDKRWMVTEEPITINVPADSDGSVSLDTDNSLDNFAMAKKEQSGIGARVAARHRFRNKRNKIVPNLSDSDSTFRDHSLRDSGDHSSEHWIDSETCTDVEELLSSKKHLRIDSPTIEGLGKKRTNGTTKTRKLCLEVESDESSKESLSYQFQQYSNVGCSKQSAQSWVPKLTHKANLDQSKTKKMSYLSTPRNHEKSYKVNRKIYAGINDIEKKWPPFEWALKYGFPNETYKACT